MKLVAGSGQLRAVTDEHEPCRDLRADPLKTSTTAGMRFTGRKFDMWDDRAPGRSGRAGAHGGRLGDSGHRRGSWE